MDAKERRKLAVDIAEGRVFGTWGLRVHDHNKDCYHKTDHPGYILGDAEASIIFLKKEAEAKGTEALVAALKEFDDRAYDVRQMEIDREVAIGRFDAFGQALSRADIKWIMSGERAQKFFGINLDAEGGANLNQFLETALDSVTTFAQEKAME